MDEPASELVLARCACSWFWCTPAGLTGYGTEAGFKVTPRSSRCPGCKEPIRPANDLDKHEFGM